MLDLLVKGAFVLFIVKQLYTFLKERKLYDGNCPRVYTAIQPLSLYAAFLPNTSLSRRLGDHWDERKTASYYKDAPLDAMVLQPFLAGRTILYSRNLTTFTQALGLGGTFAKGPNPMLSIMGENVVSAEGEVWKRHRRITAPAFNHTTYENVWDTTLRVYQEMIVAEGWAGVSETQVTNITTITHKLALFLIAIVGFGLPMQWIEPPRTQDGKLSTQRMIFDVATYIMERGVVPRWAYWLGIKKLSQIEEAYVTFESFMKERIANRERELKEARKSGDSSGEDAAELIKDVFGRLVNARLSDGKLTLSDEELVGNCFVFTFAGHETTANTLAVTLALLALHPDEQQWVYDGIIKQLGEREPTFDDFDSLTGVMACVFEGLRLFPAAYLLVRQATKDVVLTLPQRDDPSVTEPVLVKKGGTVVLDMVGMCYDPNVFPDPEVFNPRRWSSTGRAFVPTNEATQADEVTGNSPASTLEGFLGFSYGPRTCLGHKFAKVESVAFLAMLLREWKVVIDLQGETKESWRKKFLEPRFGQALLIGEVPLKFVRRK